LGIVTLVPNEEEFPCRCKQDDWAMEVWGGAVAQSNEDVI
jgi:hypothetical protein